MRFTWLVFVVEVRQLRGLGEEEKKTRCGADRESLSDVYIWREQNQQPAAPPELFEDPGYFSLMICENGLPKPSRTSPLSSSWAFSVSQRFASTFSGVTMLLRADSCGAA
jgi:hypothetical protein